MLVTMDNFSFGYVIGVLDARGTVVSDKNRVTLQVKSREYAILRKLQRVFGGLIHGPYNGLSVWYLRGKALETATPLIREHLPRLSRYL